MTATTNESNVVKVGVVSPQSQALTNQIQVSIQDLTNEQLTKSGKEIDKGDAVVRVVVVDAVRVLVDTGVGEWEIVGDAWYHFQRELERAVVASWRDEGLLVILSPLLPDQAISASHYHVILSDSTETSQSVFASTPPNVHLPPTFSFVSQEEALADVASTAIAEVINKRIVLRRGAAKNLESSMPTRDVIKNDHAARDAANHSNHVTPPPREPTEAPASALEAAREFVMSRDPVEIAKVEQARKEAEAQGKVDEERERRRAAEEADRVAKQEEQRRLAEEKQRKMEANKTENAIVKLQSLWRKRVARTPYLATVNKVVCVQSLIRQFLTRKQGPARLAAAATLQRSSRIFLAKTALSNRLASFVKVQTVVRRQPHRCWFVKQKKASGVIQGVIRLALGRNQAEGKKKHILSKQASNKSGFRTNAPGT